MIKAIESHNYETSSIPCLLYKAGFTSSIALMPLPYGLSHAGSAPDWVAEGRLVPFSKTSETPASTQSSVVHFIWQANRILFASAEKTLPLRSIPSGLQPIRSSIIGEFDGSLCHAHDIATDTPAPEGYEWSGLRALFPVLDAGMVNLAGRSFQIMEWDRTHQFCGRCGTPTLLRSSERARECPNCSLVSYPRISPVVMGLVVRGRELLLARSPHFAPGMYSAVAGFIEIGESCEQALRREILEETGIHADHFRYFDTQPWPFPHSLMIAYTAEYVSGTPVPQPEEIEDVRWFSVEDLPAIPPAISVAGRLIRAVSEHLKAEPAV
jgi:NAD+ diphosphatase